ncbi:MAG: helix-turn-helix domain-containing protein [Spirochaetaceae bacterium]|nr:helix-turn-helix domain-containing protein [Spirochaetaceae bacterium]
MKKAIIKWAADDAGIRAAARQLGVSPDTVMKELKKKKNR